MINDKEWRDLDMEIHYESDLEKIEYLVMRWARLAGLEAEWDGGDFSDTYISLWPAGLECFKAQFRFRAPEEMSRTWHGADINWVLSVQAFPWSPNRPGYGWLYAAEEFLERMASDIERDPHYYFDDDLLPPDRGLQGPAVESLRALARGYRRRQHEENKRRKHA
tara:strand:- start:522 stop:1016 length:495 start_codon:yes stop_codon:yes gene_type:complete